MALTKPETDLDSDIYGLNMSYMKNLNIMRKKLNLKEIAENEWSNLNRQSTSFTCDMVPEKLEQDNEITKPTYNERDFESRTSIRSNLHLSRRETHLDLASYMRLQDIENAYKLSNSSKEATNETNTSSPKEIEIVTKSKSVTPRTLEVPPKRVCLDKFTNSDKMLSSKQVPEMYSVTKCTQIKDNLETKKSIKKQAITKKVDQSSSAPVSRILPKNLLSNTRRSEVPKRKPTPKIINTPKPEKFSSSEENLILSVSTSKSDSIEGTFKKESTKLLCVEQGHMSNKNLPNTQSCSTPLLSSKLEQNFLAKVTATTPLTKTALNIDATSEKKLEIPTLFYGNSTNVSEKTNIKQMKEETDHLSFIKVHSSLSGATNSKLTQFPHEKFSQFSQATLTEQSSQMEVKEFVQANIEPTNLICKKEATIQAPSNSDLNRNEFSATKQSHQFSQTNCIILKPTVSKLSLTPFNYLRAHEDKSNEEELTLMYTSSSDKLKCSIRSSEEISLESDVNLPSSVQDVSKTVTPGVRVVTLTDDEVTIETNEKQENDDILKKYLELTPVLSSVTTPDTLQVSTCVSSGAPSEISQEINVRNLDELSSVSSWQTEETNDTTTSVATPKLSSVFKEYLSDYSVKHGGFTVTEEKHDSYTDFKENATQLLRDLRVGGKRRSVVEASKKYDIPEEIAFTPYDDTKKEEHLVSKDSKDIACSRKAQDTDFKYYYFSSEDSDEGDEDVEKYLKTGSEAETEEAQGFCRGCFCWGMLFSILLFCAFYI